MRGESTSVVEDGVDAALFRGSSELSRSKTERFCYLLETVTTGTEIER